MNNCHRLSETEYREISDAYNDFFTKLVESYTRYIQILDVLCVEGLVSGHVAENLRTFTNSAKTILDDLDSAGNIVHTATNMFLFQVSTEDRFG